MAPTATTYILRVIKNGCQVINEPRDNKFATYWEVTLMLCYFWLPFFGMKRALKTYTETDDLPFMSILLILFISGNILTWMILLLDGKTIRTKSWWTVGVLFIMIILNILVL